MSNFQTYFVLNGLYNGEDGVFATTCGVGKQQKDGWYWIMDGMDDGEGPYNSRENAIRAAESAEPTPEVKFREVAYELYKLGGFKCKATSWDEVGMPIPSHLLAHLDTYTSAELGIDGKLYKEFTQKPKKSMFLVTHDGGLYLVNTEGYSYARYIRYIGNTGVTSMEEALRKENNRGTTSEALDFLENRA